MSLSNKPLRLVTGLTDVSGADNSTDTLSSRTGAAVVCQTRCETDHRRELSGCIPGHNYQEGLVKLSERVGGRCRTMKCSLSTF